MSLKLLSFAVALLLVGSASAFERASSEFSAKWRWPLSGATPEVTVGLGDVSASGFPPAVLRAVLEQASASWNGAECGIRLRTGADPQVSLRFVTSLPGKKAGDTVRRGEAHKGELRRSTISLSAEWLWSDQAPLEEGALDLETLILHELGHALGFAHSFNRRAVMRAGAKQGRVKRDLHKDDSDGLCAIYPPA